MWTQADTRRSRAATCELLDRAEQGVISWEHLARNLLNWMSEQEVREFAHKNGFLRDSNDVED